MKWKIISVGKPGFPWVRDGVGMYLSRLKAFASVENMVLKKNDPALFLRAAGDAVVIALDEEGASEDTAGFARRVARWEMERVKEVAVCIGGADGLFPEVRSRADLCLNLGRFTLMHELALLVWMEQLYRVYTLKEDHPYHRA